MIYQGLKNTGKYKDNGNAVALSDISTTWAKEPIEKLVTMGAIKGYPGGVFKPEDNVTRAEAAQILFQLAIPYSERNTVKPQTFNVKTENLPEAYGVMLDDYAIDKDNLEEKILKGVTAEDEDSKAVKSMKVKKEDLDKFDKSTVGEYSVTVVFEDDEGRTAEKKVTVIVSDYEVQGWLGETSILGCKSEQSTIAIPREINGKKVLLLCYLNFAQSHRIYSCGYRAFFFAPCVRWSLAL